MSVSYTEILAVNINVLGNFSHTFNHFKQLLSIYQTIIIYIMNNSRIHLFLTTTCLLGSTLFLISACAPKQQVYDHLAASNTELVNLGKKVYDQHCSICHGAHLEGQPNWKELGPDGRLPAPPHDESGHTWHHPDSYLIHVVKEGIIAGVDKPVGYENNMPVFGKILTDKEIVATLSYIKSTWSPDYQEWQENTNKPVKKVDVK